eukprot:jgi/Orpsp1_1/1188153/evm.model.d7180000062846.1
MKLYLLYLISLFLLYIKNINASDASKYNNTNNIDDLSNDDKSSNIGDKYYLIYVKNEYDEYKIYSENKNKKRHESQFFIESLVNDINNLIINNKDTYENPEKLDEIEKDLNLKRRKRNDETEDFHNHNESNYVYPISSIKNRVVLYSYLSETLAKEIPSKFENIIECSPDEAVIEVLNQNYDINEILTETKWGNLSVRENPDFDLSLISQGKYKKSLIPEYDDNYYYPSSAGKDVDIIIFDSNFNFNYPEFSNTNDRTVKCSGVVINGKVSNDVSIGCDISLNRHGEIVSVIAGGFTSGVANRANIYGIAAKVDESKFNSSDILGGVQYIYENMIRPHKTIVNFSLGGYHNNDTYYNHLKNLIDGIIEKNGIVVAAAGNNSMNLNKSEKKLIPCEFDNVICVGGINNSEKDFDNVYKVSNFKLCDAGTSYASPIVAGIIANIISENKNIKYTKKTMLDQLINNGKHLSFLLPNNEIGILANNGKNTVYSKTGNVKYKSNNECYGQNDGIKCCNHCNSSLESGSLNYGIENNDKCIIKFSCNNSEKPTATTTIPPKPKIMSKCYGEELGFSCCNHCDISIEDDTGVFGIENNNWCGIKYSCKYRCYGQESYLPCCSHCNITYQDNDGYYGIEYNDQCGINFSCVDNENTSTTTTSINLPTTTNKNICYGQETGLPCCKYCKIIFEDID